MTTTQKGGQEFLKFIASLCILLFETTDLLLTLANRGWGQKNQ